MDVFILAGQSNMAGRGGVERGPDGKKAWNGQLPAAYTPDAGQRKDSLTELAALSRSQQQDTSVLLQLRESKRTTCRAGARLLNLCISMWTPSEHALCA